MMRKTISVVAMMFVILLAAGCEDRNNTTEGNGAVNAEQAEVDLPPPGEPLVGSAPPMPAPVARPMPEGYRVETIASGLVVPWDIAFVSANLAYVTERPGRVRLIENRTLRSQPYAIIDVVDSGEGGLMGIALHPDYPNPRHVYLMYTYRDEGHVYSRVSRFTDTGEGLTEETPVITRIPGAAVHNGGIIRFGPDGMLYIGTGDARNAELAQDRSSLAGKILRVTPTGGIPSDNPFSGSPVYAYGFRNVQGLAWNPANGYLWATNHGPTGEFGLRAMDSVYIVEKGANHGWPRALGATNARGVVDPMLFFRQRAVPPALAAFYDHDLMPDLKGNLFFATLGDETLYRVVLSGPREISQIEQWWRQGPSDGRYGRLRAVVQGADGALYVSTSNRARGSPAASDDRILRISPR